MKIKTGETKRKRLKHKKLLLLCILFIMQIGILFSQNIASGATEQFQLLLNNPTMVSSAIATPLGRNWFTLKTDIHVFTDQANFQQIVDVLLDMDNQEQIYNGKKSKLISSIVSKNEIETIVDFVSVDIGPFGIQYRTPYSASVRNELTDTKIKIELIQLASNSSSNKNMKNFYSIQYAEEVTINSGKYTYIRILTICDVNASIIPSAKGILEREAVPTSIEGLQMVINAAKNRC